MPDTLEVRVEKFIPTYSIILIPFFFLLLLCMIILGEVLMSLGCAITILLSFYLVHFHKKIKRNPVILKIASTGLYLPHRGIQLHWKNFISWKNFIDIVEIFERGNFMGMTVNASTIYILYKDDEQETHKTRLVYTSGKDGGALNYTKQQIIELVKDRYKKHD